DRVAVIDDAQIAECGSVTEVFSDPRSEKAKEFVLPFTLNGEKDENKKTYRLVFNRESSGQPIISGLAIEKGIAVNVVYADTKVIDGRRVGHMILDVDKKDEKEFTDYLDSQSVEYREN
ncbi:MAG: methionine ABC transporter ATP-binding protein, partial [Clostridia bacterium]|nr:methionine ABC transporter ATP-binding protein [Clostridia bacterium]